MKDELISQFIDNELDLNEKIVFVETVHSDPVFTQDALSLLQQEKILTMPVPVNRPILKLSSIKPRRSFGLFFKSLSTGLATAAVTLFLLWPKTTIQPVSHRFVIFAPEIGQAEIAGSFSNWKPLSMKPAGQRGYWELSLDLPPGEHRYSYLLDGNRRTADPTTLLKEEDDFGSVNSIIRIGI
ncbi:MAG TPA: glycogen-binding domain-containing protein [Desulfatirhabdiaceae bacterium]|nr:glycogen-binding domain-containing protein [Desulfatirhabdiaceae bacterium]